MTARESIIYHYLASNRGQFFNVRQVAEALGMTPHQARYSLYELWRKTLITSDEQHDDTHLDARSRVLPYRRRGVATISSDRRSIGVAFGIEEAEK